MRYIDCKECDVKLPPAWRYYNMILTDNMIDHSMIDDIDPFMVSHISFDMDNCPECDYELSEHVSLSFCLVNHGDNGACLHCPGCKNYVENTGVWHKTEWTRDDLKDDGKPYKIEIPGEDIFYIMGELKATKFPPGRIKDLK